MVHNNTRLILPLLYILFIAGARCSNAVIDDLDVVCVWLPFNDACECDVIQKKSESRIGHQRCILVRVVESGDDLRCLRFQKTLNGPFSCRVASVIVIVASILVAQMLNVEI